MNEFLDNILGLEKGERKKPYNNISCHILQQE